MSQVHHGDEERGGAFCSVGNPNNPARYPQVELGPASFLFSSRFSIAWMANISLALSGSSGCGGGGGGFGIDSSSLGSNHSSWHWQHISNSNSFSPAGRVIKDMGRPHIGHRPPEPPGIPDAFIQSILTNSGCPHNPRTADSDTAWPCPQGHAYAIFPS